MKRKPEIHDPWVGPPAGTVPPKLRRVLVLVVRGPELLYAEIGDVEDTEGYIDHAARLAMRAGGQYHLAEVLGPLKR